MAPWSRKKGKAKGRKDQLLERRNGRRRKATSLPAEVAAASRVGGDETETTTKSERNSPVIVGRPRRNSLLGAHSPFGPPTETEKRNNVAESTQNGSSAEERRGHRRQLAVSVSVEKLELLLTAMGEDVANTELSPVDRAIAELQDLARSADLDDDGGVLSLEDEPGPLKDLVRKKSLTPIILEMLDEVGDIPSAQEAKTSPLKKLERQKSFTPMLLRLLTELGDPNNPCECVLSLKEAQKQFDDRQLEVKNDVQDILEGLDGLAFSHAAKLGVQKDMEADGASSGEDE
jgi:hypothetical protein